MRVSAQNDRGYGAYTNSTPYAVAPKQVPGKPSAANVELSVIGTTELQVAYDEDAHDGGDTVDRYKVEWDTAVTFDSQSRGSSENLITHKMQKVMTSAHTAPFDAAAWGAELAGLLCANSVGGAKLRLERLREGLASRAASEGGGLDLASRVESAELREAIRFSWVRATARLSAVLRL